MSTQEMEVAQSPTQALSTQLRAVKPYLDRLVPNPERFGATLMITARRNPDLLRCDPATVVGAALVCARIDLEPGEQTDYVYLIPRRNKKTNTIDCTLLLGKNGMKVLAERHPLINSVRSGTVYEGDDFEYTKQPPALTHTPKFASTTAIRWYAVADRNDGHPPHIAVLDRVAVEERRKHSASPEVGPWKTHYNQMAEKSAIRALWKELPSSLDLSRAAQIDDSTGVVTPRDLLIGQPKLIDAATGEIITSPPEKDDSARDPEPAGTPSTPAAAAQAAPSAPRPEDSAPGQGNQHPGDVTARHGAGEPAPEPQPSPDRPMSATQAELIELMRAEFRFDRVASPWYSPQLVEGPELSFEEATEVIKHYAAQLESWRLNRRSRLASVADTHSIDLPGLLQARGLGPAGELTAAVCWELIDELGASQSPAVQPSDGEAVSAPAADEAPEGRLI